jgi:DNA repair exonuclease SbcCD nuclease subunit
MRVIVSGDLHLKSWDDKHYINNLPRKLNDILMCFNQMCEYATSNNINTIIIAGDTNDTKNVVYTIGFVLLKKIIEKYNNINFYFIHGNHDSTQKVDKYSAIELLNGTNNVRCVTTENFVLDNIIMVPFSHEIYDVVNALPSHDILISHFGVNDAQLSSGISISSPVGLKELSKFKLVLLGHYHKPQNLGNVYYCGSIIQLRRDEKNEDKRFLVVDTNTFSVDSVLTTGYRKYVEIEVSDDSDIDTVLKEADLLRNEGHYVYIKNTSSKKLKIPDQYKNDIIVIDTSIEQYEMRGINCGMTIDEQLSKWADITKMDDANKPLYINYALSILNKEEQTNGE